MKESYVSTVAAVAEEADPPAGDGKTLHVAPSGQVVNASGHRDQLKRQFKLLSICGQSVTADNAWVAMAISLTVAVSNGGPAGVIYELIVAVFYYCFIAAAIAELASAIPSAGGVYHWASITPGPRAGRLFGFYAGLINFLSWVFAAASIVYVQAEVIFQSWTLYHPEFLIQTWYLFVAMAILTGLGVAAVIFGNRALPAIQSFSGLLVVGGCLVSIIILAVMPTQRAPSSFVWTAFDANNLTGWPSGIAFLAGMLNGAFTIGTPDSVTHMAEEMPDPGRDIPRSIAVQMATGFVTSLAFVIVLFYGINDLPAVISSNFSFPVAGAYYQATESQSATVGLLVILFLSETCGLVACILICSRTWWALARDNAVPFSKFFASVNERHNCPIPATVFCGLITIAICATTLGSKTGFSDIIGSFVILTTTSYALAIGPNLWNRYKYLPKGSFSLGRAGIAVNIIALLSIVFFNVIFCLPYVYPTTVDLMNYNSVILVGTMALITVWWLVHGVRNYPMPKVVLLYHSVP